MIRSFIVRHSAVDDKGNLLYPGEWVETYVLIPSTGVWMLIGFQPKQEVA